jgi:hypothetical protein
MSTRCETRYAEVSGAAGLEAARAQARHVEAHRLARAQRVHSSALAKPFGQRLLSAIAVGDGVRIGGSQMNVAAIVLFVALLPTALASAKTRIAGDEHFRTAVAAQIEALRTDDLPVMRKLVEAVSTCPAVVEVRSITGDRTTWHPDGNPTRGHTDPTDGKPKRQGRDRPTDAWLYIPASAVQRNSRLWTSGVFVHELTHAMDLVCGRYHPDGPVRERRAVWVQNAWRHRLGQMALRSNYHGQFATTDFQDALRERRLEDYERFLFTRSDFPPPRR